MLPFGLEYKSSGEDGSVKIEHQVRSKEIYTNTYLERERERDLPLLKLAGEESEAMAREKQERDESGD